jgi:hypothetical protein
MKYNFDTTLSFAVTSFFRIPSRDSVRERGPDRSGRVQEAEEAKGGFDQGRFRKRRRIIEIKSSFHQRKKKLKTRRIKTEAEYFQK